MGEAKRGTWASPGRWLKKLAAIPEKEWDTMLLLGAKIPAAKIAAAELRAAMKKDAPRGAVENVFDRIDGKPPQPQIIEFVQRAKEVYDRVAVVVDEVLREHLDDEAADRIHTAIAQRLSEASLSGTDEDCG